MNQHLRLPLLLPYGHKVKSNTVSGRTHTHKHISFKRLTCWILATSNTAQLPGARPFTFPSANSPSSFLI